MASYNFNWPSPKISQGPVQYILNGAIVSVTEDQAVPANSKPLPVKVYPLNPAGFGRIAAPVTNITTGAYVTLLTVGAAATYEMQIDNTTGKTLYLATGAPGSEVDILLIPPGGLLRQTCLFLATTRLSVKAVQANATTGEVNANLFN